VAVVDEKDGGANEAELTLLAEVLEHLVDLGAKGEEQVLPQYLRGHERAQAVELPSQRSPHPPNSTLHRPCGAACHRRGRVRVRVRARARARVRARARARVRVRVRLRLRLRGRVRVRLRGRVRVSALPSERKAASQCTTRWPRHCA